MFVAVTGGAFVGILSGSTWWRDELFWRMWVVVKHRERTKHPIIILDCALLSYISWLIQGQLCRIATIIFGRRCAGTMSFIRDGAVGGR